MACQIRQRGWSGCGGPWVHMAWEIGARVSWNLFFLFFFVSDFFYQPTSRYVFHSPTWRTARYIAIRLRILRGRGDVRVVRYAWQLSFSLDKYQCHTALNKILQSLAVGSIKSGSNKESEVSGRNKDIRRFAVVATSSFDLVFWMWLGFWHSNCLISWINQQLIQKKLSIFRSIILFHTCMTWAIYDHGFTVFLRLSWHCTYLPFSSDTDLLSAEEEEEQGRCYWCSRFSRVNEGPAFRLPRIFVGGKANVIQSCFCFIFMDSYCYPRTVGPGKMRRADPRSTRISVHRLRHILTSQCVMNQHYPETWEFGL